MPYAFNGQFQSLAGVIIIHAEWLDGSYVTIWFQSLAGVIIIHALF